MNIDKMVWLKEKQTQTTQTHYLWVKKKKPISPKWSLNSKTIRLKQCWLNRRYSDNSFTLGDWKKKERKKLFADWKPGANATPIRSETEMSRRNSDSLVFFYTWTIVFVALHCKLSVFMERFSILSLKYLSPNFCHVDLVQFLASKFNLCQYFGNQNK